MVPQDANLLLLDHRVEFKLFAAEHHLRRLEEIEKRTGSLASEERVYAEIHIDGFLSEIIGAKDALLQEINEKLALGLDPRRVGLETVNVEIDDRRQIPSDLLSDINQIGDNSSWLWKLNEYRNHSHHRGRLLLFVKKDMFTGEVKTYLKEDPLDPSSGPLDVEITTYLRDCLQKMTELIKNTRRRIPQ